MVKTYKKKQDNFLRNIVIGFGVVFFVMMAIFLYMSITEPKYNDFEQVGVYENADNMPEGTYGVYFYSETCPACVSIKSSFLEFAEGNALDLKIYLMDSAQTTGDRLSSFSFYDADEGEVLQLTATPTLLIYKDGTLVDMIVSADSIQEFMIQVGNNEYTELD